MKLLLDTFEEEWYCFNCGTEFMMSEMVIELLYIELTVSPLWGFIEAFVKSHSSVAYAP